jgi:hypothetical protein
LSAFTKIKMSAAALLIAVAAFALATGQFTKDPDRRTVLLSVVQKNLIHERGKERVNISYRSSSSEWRHIEYKGLDPWNRNVSVKKGDTVYLEAWQQAANQIDCLISIPALPGVVDNATRRSIGTVKCKLVVPK